jgi:CRP-like cAMP-binding protein
VAPELPRLTLSNHAECTVLTGLARHLAEQGGIGRAPRVLRPGEVLYRQGEVTDHLYLVQEGVVRESLISQSGRELRLTVAGPGETVGELCFCSIRERQETMVADAPAVVVPIYAQDVLEYVLRGPEAALEVLEYLFHRIGTLTERLQELAFAHVRERIVRTLLEMAAAAAARPGSQAPNGGVVLSPMTHEEWASQVYATREQVTAILAELRRQRAIHYRGRRSPLVVYPQRLREQLPPD